MKYHETVPSEPGDYKSCAPGCDRFISRSQSGKWWDDSDDRLQDHLVSDYLPLLGPLPSTNDEAITLACEVQFARMCLAMLRNPFRWDEVPGLQERYNGLVFQFEKQGSSLSLYRDMERVTEELGGGA